MLSKACSAAVNGIDAYQVEVEVREGYGDTISVVVSCILPMSEEQSGAGKMICKSVEKEENREKAPCWSWAKKTKWEISINLTATRETRAFVSRRSIDCPACGRL